jgi:hypothetical protein
VATARTSAASSRPSSPSDAGVGLVGTLAGVTVFLVLLLFAVQVLLNLYATSVVTAAAFDAARDVATAGGDPAAVSRAEAKARDVLGRYADEVAFEWTVPSGDDVVLHVHAENRMFVFAGLRLDPLHTVERTVRARIECFRSETNGCE